MIVISDTTPISSLLKIEKIDLLLPLFSKVVIPPAVKTELSAWFAGNSLFEKFLNEEWVHLDAPSNHQKVKELLEEIDIGESEAITLAKELHADYILIDEMDGRKIARREGLQIIGTAGILLLAKKKRLLPAVKPELDKLFNIGGFWLEPKIYSQILRDAEE